MILGEIHDENALLSNENKLLLLGNAVFHTKWVRTLFIPPLTSEYGIHPNQLYKWKAQALDGLPKLFDDERKTEKALKATHEQELQELYAEIGRLTTQLTWLQKKSGLNYIEK